MQSHTHAGRNLIGNQYNDMASPGDNNATSVPELLVTPPCRPAIFDYLLSIGIPERCLAPKSESHTAGSTRAGGQMQPSAFIPPAEDLSPEERLILSSLGISMQSYAALAVI
mmetsp:Transcript_39633/g.100540  ORF Transcript_39633/g.100540 Transcript_39633/m.100540 type:complete len:112 (+) Transcript_39633:69-404(+)